MIRKTEVTLLVEWDDEATQEPPQNWDWDRLVMMSTRSPGEDCKLIAFEELP